MLSAQSGRTLHFNRPDDAAQSPVGGDVSGRAFAGGAAISAVIDEEDERRAVTLVNNCPTKYHGGQLPYMLSLQ